MNVIKKIGKVIAVITIILLVTLAGLFIYHRVNLSKNRKFLEEKGYYNLVSVGNHSLNLIKYGNAEEGHRVIALGGNGAGFPIELQKLASELENDNQVYYLARAAMTAVMT